MPSLGVFVSYRLVTAALRSRCGHYIYSDPLIASAIAGDCYILVVLLWSPAIVEDCYILVVLFIMVTLWNRADHYIFMLLFMAALCNRAGHIYFYPVISFYLLLSFFYSSPNLSGHRLDVYHTSTHGVALVRI